MTGKMEKIVLLGIWQFAFNAQLYLFACLFQERVKSVFHAKEFGKIINFKTPEDAKVNMKCYYYIIY